jgi:hypothetical protein
MEKPQSKDWGFFIYGDSDIEVLGEWYSEDGN